VLPFFAKLLRTAPFLENQHSRFSVQEDFRMIFADGPDVACLKRRLGFPLGCA
jgi:hypothetical protein